MTLNLPVKSVNTLLAAIAAVLLAVPAWAQDAGEPADDPAASAEAAQDAPPVGEEEQPGDAGEAAEAPAGSEEAAGTAADEAAKDPAGGPIVVDIEEGSVLDDQTFEGEDDDFIPSEEIPIDQPIPFPTDI